MGQVGELLGCIEEGIRQDRKKLTQSETRTVRFKSIPSKEC